MLLAELVETSTRLAATRSRLEKTRLLADLLRRLEGREIEIAVDYLSGVLPQGRIGVGGALVRRAMPPEAAGEARLRLAEVDERFERIARVGGSGAQARRAEALNDLFSRATAPEQYFLARLLVGELRQGALEGLMAEAIAAASGSEPDGVRRAVMVAGDLAEVARSALEEGRSGLSRYAMQVFRPIQPMLAQTCEDVAESLDSLERAAFEFKLDGARIQVHKRDREIAVFSRRLRDVTGSLPEVVEAARGLDAHEVILDGEVLALRPDGRPHPFQVTMRRFGRKLDVDELRRELPLSPSFFDCLLVDGEDLLERPAEARFSALAAAVPRAWIVPRKITADRREAEAFLEEALARGHEGVMAKDPGAAYEAGSRGRSWLKLKRYHTLDLVVLAAEWGHGRRRGWLSNLHLGARDPRSGAFVMLGKTFKGLTDEMLGWQTRRLLELETSRDRHTVTVEPRLVVEVAFNDVQESSQYPGGLALRFARVKSYRTDKGPGDADTFDAVKAIWEGDRA